MPIYCTIPTTGYKRNVENRNPCYFPPPTASRWRRLNYLFSCKKLQPISRYWHWRQGGPDPNLFGSVILDFKDPDHLMYAYFLPLLTSRFDWTENCWVNLSLLTIAERWVGSGSVKSKYESKDPYKISYGSGRLTEGDTTVQMEANLYRTNSIYCMYMLYTS